MPDYRGELETVIGIAKDVGQYLHEEWFCKIKSGEITKGALALISKGSHKDYSTGPDRESERRILARLRDAFGNTIPVLAEETQSGVLFPTGEGWVVDPLDGTRRFRNGIEEYSVAITRFKDNKPIAGVVYAPSASNAGYPAEHTGELFAGVRGEGVTLNGKPLKMLNTDDELKDSLILIGWNYQTGEEYFKMDLAGLADVLPACADASRGGSGAYDCCKIAAGRFGSYFERSWGDPWSLSAGIMFTEQLGGVASDYRGGEIDYFRKRASGRGFDIQWVVSKNRKIHDEILKRLKV